MLELPMHSACFRWRDHQSGVREEDRGKVECGKGGINSYLKSVVKVVISVNISYICSMKEERKILFYKDYFISFYRSLNGGVQKKIDYVLGMLKIEERVSEKFVKYIRDGLYEIRVSYNGEIYWAFFIFDDGNIVMLFNGFQKKTQKTPGSEINKALELKKEYYAGKE